MGIGLKRRVDAILVDYNQATAEAIQARINKATSNLQNNVQAQTNKVKETSAFKATKEVTDKFSPFIRPVIKFYLFISGYGKLLEKAGSYITGFDDQRLKIVKSLNPIPGIKGTLVAVGALAANIGYLTLPILSKMWVFSGLTSGYATGLYVMRHTNFRWLQSNQYDRALNITLYGKASAASY